MDCQPCHYPKSSLQIWTLFSVVCYDPLLVGGVRVGKYHEENECSDFICDVPISDRQLDAAVAQS